MQSDPSPSLITPCGPLCSGPRRGGKSGIPGVLPLYLQRWTYPGMDFGYRTMTKVTKDYIDQKSSLVMFSWCNDMVCEKVISVLIEHDFKFEESTLTQDIHKTIIRHTLTIWTVILDFMNLFIFTHRTWFGTEADGASNLATETGLPRHRGCVLSLQSIRSMRMKDDELNEKVWWHINTYHP